MEFKAWPKIARWQNARWAITEKIDGTNACVVVYHETDWDKSPTPELKVGAQSRTRIITPQDDNFGFAAWVENNKEELKKLGPGYHFGEWWGLGIQRGYGLKEKRFSLFKPWGCVEIPECCHVVPNIECGNNVARAIEVLKEGSIAVPGWGRPEGFVISSRDFPGILYKYILDK